MSVGSIILYGTDKSADESGSLIIPDNNSEILKSRLDAMVTAGNASTISIEILNENYSKINEGEEFNTPVGFLQKNLYRKAFEIQSLNYDFKNFDKIDDILNVLNYNYTFLGVDDYIIDNYLTANTNILAIVVNSTTVVSNFSGYRQLIIEAKARKYG